MNATYFPLAIIVTTAILFPTMTMAKDKKKESLKIEGQVSSEFNIENNRGLNGYSGDIKFKTKRTKTGTKAVLKLTADNDAETVAMKEAYVDHKLGKTTKLQFGKLKKRLGLQYEKGSKKRTTIHRNLIYKKLEDYSFVGRTYMARYHQELSDESQWSLGLGNSDSLDSFIISHYESSLFKNKHHHWGTWLLLQADKIEHSYQYLAANITSIWGDIGQSFYEFELASGQDPHESEYEKLHGDGRRVYYAATRLLLGYNFRLSGESKWQLFTELTYIHHDLRDYARSSQQSLLGANYYFHKDLRLAVNGEFVGNRGDRSYQMGRNSHDRIYRLEVRYDF